MPRMPRIAVVDQGTNSTRLLAADVDDGAVTELERRTIVTRFGEGVDTTGRLSDAAIGRVEAAFEGYRAIIDRLEVGEIVGVATSAMRDAENGPAFRERALERFGIDLVTISGDEEARLTFRGATAARGDTVETVVVDIGGGSTEYVVGRPAEDPSFRVSARMGSVRHTERFIEGDPPGEVEVRALSDAVAETVADEVPEDLRTQTEHGIAVAGTATTLAAIDQELDPYDPDRVHGYRLGVDACELILGQLASVTLEERRQVTGLHPDRAPTIVAGAAILLESMRAFGLEEIEISERDILHGAALAAVDGSFPRDPL